MSHRLSARAALPALALLAVTACSTDDVAAPRPRVEGDLTVDASTSWAYVSLSQGATVTPTPSARESSAWDIAFNATNVILNGGAAGPGAIQGFCICQNATASNTEVLAMTPASEESDFDAVATTVAGGEWTSEVLTPAFRDWFTSAGTGAQASPSKAVVLRLAEGTSYAKVRVSSLQSPAALHAGRVTLEYAVQPQGATAFGPTQTLTVDLATGAKQIDLNAGATTTDAATWDLRFDGYAATINGGVSGPGQAGLYNLAAGESFATLAAAPSAAQAYGTTDRYQGIFFDPPWYKYNIAGDNRISPTFNVYLVRRGDVTYKVQITNYYGPTGASRQITFRYASL